MDGGTGSSKHIQDPEALLRSALEKIVFFECRVSQLESELAGAKAAAERARGDAATAHRREVELEQALAGEKGQRGDVDRRAAEAEERVRLLETERERLLAGLVERARVAGAPGAAGAPQDEDGQADLAGFIAELRAEIETLRAFKAQAVAAGFTGPEPGQAASRPTGADRSVEPASVAELGGRFDAAGRVGVTSTDAARMKELLATRADRALYERSMEDLSAQDAGRRLRAVRALEALGSRAAAPLLAAALSREPEAEVKRALLGALARFKEPFAGGLAERELGDRRPEVRVAALEALAGVASTRSTEVLARALEDESPLVRRRAALLLGFTSGERAVDALALALCDLDRGVARTAAAALAGRPSARAQAALARGLEHGDPSVRRAAAVALGQLSGEVVDAEGSASARRAGARRIAERLASMDGEELRAAVIRSAATAKATAERIIAKSRTAPAAVTATAAATAAATPTPIATAAATPTPIATTPTPTPTASPRPAAAPRFAAVAAPRTAVAVLDAPAPAAAGDDLGIRIVAELRAALRGCTEPALSSVLGTPEAAVLSSLSALAARGLVEKRGMRWFTA
jgi:HEAT repeat protein